MAEFNLISEAAGKIDTDHHATVYVRPAARLWTTAKCYTTSLCLLAFVNIALFFYAVAIKVTYPYELDYAEGIVLCQTQRITNFSTAYAPITHYPYIVVNYPPLYYIASLVVSKFTTDLLLAGRMVSAFSSVGICLTLAWLVYRSVPAFAPRIAATGGAVLAVAFACGLDVMRWAPLMRVDMLGLWLTFSGLAVFILARTWPQRYGAFVLFLAAMFTKQTLVASPIACLLVTAIIDLRWAIKLLAFVASLGGAILTILFMASHGEVIKHFFLYNQNPFSSRQAIGALNLNIQTTVPLLALAVTAACGPLLEISSAFAQQTAATLRARLSTSTYRLAVFTVTVHFLLSGLMSLTVGKTGSNINYLLEWNLSACALTGLFSTRLLWNWRTKHASLIAPLPYLLLTLMLVQQAGALLRLVTHLASASHLDPTQTTMQPIKYDLLKSELEPGIMAEHALNSEAVLGILRNRPEPVMSEDMTLLYKAGKQVPFEPFMAAELAAAGKWDETPLVNLIRKRAFSVMVIRDLRYRYSPAVAQAISESYQPMVRYGDLTVFVPSQ